MSVPPGVQAEPQRVSAGEKYSYENIHKATLTNTVFFRFQRPPVSHSAFPPSTTHTHTCTHTHACEHKTHQHLSHMHFWIGVCFVCFNTNYFLWTIIPWGNEFHLFLSSWYSLCLEGCLANWRLYVHTYVQTYMHQKHRQCVYSAYTWYTHLCILEPLNAFVSHLLCMYFSISVYIFIYINRFGTNAFNGSIILLLMIKHIKSLNSWF